MYLPSGEGDGNALFPVPFFVKNVYDEMVPFTFKSVVSAFWMATMGTEVFTRLNIGPCDPYTIPFLVGLQ